jgi:hypothetical protein
MIRITHRRLKVMFGLLVLCLPGACLSISQDPESLRLQVTELTTRHGFSRHEFEAEGFGLVGYVRPSTSAPIRNIHVYIEGDGRAWLSPTRISRDPTPRNPVGLKLALQDPSDMVIYLARPCQYLAPEASMRCSPHLWGKDRFSDRVITAMSTALDQMIDINFHDRASSSPSLTLAGFSGGGVVAVLLAARRRDIQMLVTISAPLDVESWTRFHGVGKVATGWTTAELARQTGAISQVHFVGDEDDIVPPAIVQGFALHLPDDRHSVVTRAGYSHHCCWTTDWKETLLSFGN